MVNSGARAAVMIMRGLLRHEAYIGKPEVLRPSGYASREDLHGGLVQTQIAEMHLEMIAKTDRLARLRRLPARIRIDGSRRSFEEMTA